MTESFSGTLAGSCGPTLLLLEVTSSFFFLASSFCCQWLWSWTVIRQMTHPSTGYSLKPTTLAQCLHIEQQALENICNYFKADEDFCSQPPDQLCLEKKKRRKIRCIKLWAESSLHRSAWDLLLSSAKAWSQPWVCGVALSPVVQCHLQWWKKASLAV